MLDSDKILKIEICTVNGNVLQSITNGFSFPKKIVDNRLIENLMMIKGSKLPIYAKGSQIIVVAYLKSGDRVSYSSVVDISTDGQLNISIYFDKAKVLEERRRYYKIECDIYCKVTSLTRGDDRLIFDPPFEGRLKNINLGGVFVSLRQEIEFRVEDVITVVTPDFKGSKMEFVLQVLRVQVSGDGKIAGFGCRFLYLDPKQETLLAKHINTLQIEKRFQERFNK